ncbi:DUF1638 domain-containing protein [Donghicola mangrovi]|uniref:DUF1638 domain-containing protein n=1 Tax=Donghicola mangrovi TaxID=2729614 RepID=A0A850Q8L6_9RHOB|nr:DUF1638 domain-containing protein [Donghicola mangrovi]NVO23090.1 DUF1638 domain-containing protein [Donghicola mangrovi]
MAVTPDDNELTYNGATLGDTGKVLLLACGALAREVLAVRDANGWTHLDVTCLPAILHNTPERIPDAVTEAVTKHRADYDRIYVLYADCGTGGLLEAQCKHLGVQMMRGPHCYSFFEGNEAFAARDEFIAFYLTDFLVRQFDAFVWKPLGLDRHPSLRDIYFGNYEKLVYQAQTDDPALTAKAQECADRLNLPLERRFTGYGDLETEMKAFAAD